MSRLLYTSNSGHGALAMLDPYGVAPYTNFMQNEFPMVEFASYMGLDAQAVSGTCTAHNYSLVTMNDILLTLNPEKVKKFHNSTYKSIFEDNSLMPGPSLMLAFMFSVQDVKCLSCNRREPAVLYYAPMRSINSPYMKSIKYAMDEGMKFNQVESINAPNCPSCFSAGFLDVISHSWWRSYSRASALVGGCCSCQGCSG